MLPSSECQQQVLCSNVTTPHPLPLSTDMLSDVQEVWGPTHCCGHGLQPDLQLAQVLLGR